MRLHPLQGIAVVVFILLTTPLLTGPPAYSLTPKPKFFVTELALYDFAGERIQSVATGEPAIIRITLQSYVEYEQQFLLIVDVIDGNRVTKYVGWQTGMLPGGESYSASILWSPDRCLLPEACIGYQLRSFASDGFIFEGSHVLAGMIREDISVMDTTIEDNRLYRLDFSGEEYEIEYSIDSGFIDSITVTKGLATVILKLESVVNDTELTLKLPKKLMAEIASCGGKPVPIELLIEPIGFVDSIPLDIRIVEWSDDSAILNMMVESGSREVEVVVGCVAF